LIIHPPELQTIDDELRISAAIESTPLLPHAPARLWFGFPPAYRDYLCERSDGFLAALIPLAMHLGEPVEVRGPVSPRLAAGLEHFQDAYQSLHPALFKRVPVTFRQLAAPALTPAPTAAAAAFSGGIDSFYTLWSHQASPQAKPAGRLTHGLFMQGFDIRLHEMDYYQGLYRRYAQLFDDLGLTLLQARTNAYAFTQFHLDWVYAHTGILAGVALTLGGLLGCFYKPGGNELRDGRVRLAAYYVGDLSTESLEIRLDGPGLTRPPKIQKIKDWKPAQDHLRVCMNVQHEPSGQACYNCAKCLEAALYLELYGARLSFRNFTQPVSRLKFITFTLKSGGAIRYYPDLPGTLRAYRRYDLLVLYWLLAPLNEAYHYLRGWLAALLPARWRLELERRFYANQIDRASE
jgi:hypothetical protein